MNDYAYPYGNQSGRSGNRPSGPENITKVRNQSGSPVRNPKRCAIFLTPFLSRAVRRSPEPVRKVRNQSGEVCHFSWPGFSWCESDLQSGKSGTSPELTLREQIRQCYDLDIAASGSCWAFIGVFGYPSTLRVGVLRLRVDCAYDVLRINTTVCSSMINLFAPIAIWAS